MMGSLATTSGQNTAARKEWEFVLNNIEVSFYALQTDTTRYDKALEKYRGKTGEILGQIRAQMSVARPLVRESTYEKIDVLLSDLATEFKLTPSAPSR